MPVWLSQTTRPTTYLCFFAWPIRYLKSYSCVVLLLFKLVRDVQIHLHHMDKKYKLSDIVRENWHIPFLGWVSSFFFFFGLKASVTLISCLFISCNVNALTAFSNFSAGSLCTVLLLPPTSWVIVLPLCSPYNLTVCWTGTGASHQGLWSRRVRISHVSLLVLSSTEIWRSVSTSRGLQTCPSGRRHISTPATHSYLNALHIYIMLYITQMHCDALSIIWYFNSSKLALYASLFMLCYT